jgi:hypothetical protein
MPQTRQRDRVRSASAGTWPDRTSTPAAPASAPSLAHRGNSAERCRLPSRPFHRHEQCNQPRDARDKGPRTLPHGRSCGRYRAALYNTVRPHSSLGNLPPVDYAKLGVPASQRACKAKMANRLYSSLDEKRGSVTYALLQSLLFPPLTGRSVLRSEERAGVPLRG